MSITQPTGTVDLQDARFLNIWNAAVKKYNALVKVQGGNMHVFGTKEEVLDYIKKSTVGFEKFREKEQRIMKFIDPILDIVGILCGTAGEAVGQVFQLSKAIFTGIGMVIQQVKATSDMYDTVSEMLENLHDILARFRIHNETNIDTELAEIYIRSISQVLYIIGLITETIKKGHFRAVVRNVTNRNKKFLSAISDLSGLSGSGKSVLMSAAISHLEDSKKVAAYFYFDFRDPSKQTVKDMVASLLFQLSIDLGVKGQEILKRLYENHQQKGTKPSIQELETAFKTVVSLPDMVDKFLFIDALDEMENQELGDFLKIMQDIQNLQIKNLHILIASHPQIVNITEDLELICGSSMGFVLLDKAHIDHDVEIFLDMVLTTRPGFKDKTKNMKTEIKKNLLENSNGM
ncbi:hypothetical protein VKT23_000158 [Stygiomarasmius scandens]|uniref:NACHT domain-containing protein n=1 Tax=Marasmiellus scandens TaxID=2682957 RepID=A0ABR1K4E0_9AGAR